MSRSGYTDDGDNWGLIKWRGMVASATRGKRGQKLFIELAEAMDAMPVKELVRNELQTPEGGYCALGVVGAKRGVDLTQIDPEEPEQVAAAFDIAECLAQEIVYENDERSWKYDGKQYRHETPAERWTRMRKWVAEQIRSTQHQTKTCSSSA